MRPPFVGTIAVTVAVGLVVVAVFVGSADMEAARVWRALVDGPGAAGRDPAHTIVWQLRLPRALLALAVGGGLSVVGVAMQALVRNPLAEARRVVARRRGRWMCKRKRALQATSL